MKKQAPEQTALRNELRDQYPRDRTQLLPVLHFIHHKFGYLPDWAIELTGWHLGIPSSEVYGSLTSYPELRTTKPAQSVVRICTGLSCWFNGGKDLLDYAESTFAIQSGQTTSDGKISLSQAPCGYLCSLAPSIEVNGTWTGQTTSEVLKSLIEETPVP